MEKNFAAQVRKTLAEKFPLEARRPFAEFRRFGLTSPPPRMVPCKFRGAESCDVFGKCRVPTQQRSGLRCICFMKIGCGIPATSTVGQQNEKSNDERNSTSQNRLPVCLTDFGTNTDYRLRATVLPKKETGLQHNVWVWQDLVWERHRTEKK
jgi:hypothetical protein